MANTYSTTVTTVGASIIAACLLNGEKMTITQAAAGDGGGAYYQPSVDQTELKGEKWRGEIASAGVNASNPNMFDVKIVVDGNVGGFIVRELGVFDDSGHLIAICNTPDMEKVVGGNGVSGKLTTVMHIVVADSSAVSFTINPSLGGITADELNEAIEGHNTSDNPHPGKFAVAGHTHTAANVGADRSGTASAAVSAHNTSDNPHPGKFAVAGHTHTAANVGAATTALYTATVNTTWTADITNGGYYKTVTVSGMLATDTPISDVVLGADIDANALYLDAWACVTRITTEANQVKLWANETAPTVAFTIQLKVVR